DRKSGHCLRDRVNEVVLGIDHGLSFHEAWKLRTVIWDFAGEPVPPPLVDDLCRLVAGIERGPLADALGQLLAPEEIRATGGRARELARDGVYPTPELGYRSVPWPLV